MLKLSIGHPFAKILALALNHPIANSLPTWAIPQQSGFIYQRNILHTVINANNQAIDLAYNPEHHQKTKHIARRHFYVRELVEEKTINVPFVQSADNLADFFTKPLPARVFVPMRNRIMNVLTDRV